MSAGADADLDRVLGDLAAARLQPDDWERVRVLLVAIDTSGDPDPGTAVDELTTFLFEAKVRGRFAGNRVTAGLEPTKQTSVLPWVGLVCGGLLVAVGALLGGGVILAGIVALGLFVFGIAYAGSHVAHRRPDADPDPVVPPEPIPDDVAVIVHERRQR